MLLAGCSVKIQYWQKSDGGRGETTSSSVKTTELQLTFSQHKLLQQRDKMATVTTYHCQ